jgi:hypothetical protein
MLCGCARYRLALCAVRPLHTAAATDKGRVKVKQRALKKAFPDAIYSETLPIEQHHGRLLKALRVRDKTLLFHWYCSSPLY